MMSRSTYFFLLGLVLIVITAWEPTPAQACTSDEQGGLSMPIALPSDGSSAPQNTRIWIPAPVETYQHGTTEADDFELTSDGSTLAFTTTVISVAGGWAPPKLWVLEPIELLPEGSTVEVWLFEKQLSSFAVFGGQDQDAPELPTITAIDVRGSFFGAFSCPEPAQVKVTVENQEHLLVVANTSAEAVFPEGVIGLGAGGSATAVELEPGDLELQVLAVDLAGNQSAPIALPTVSVPPEVSGCSVGAAPTLPSTWFLVGSFLLLWNLRKNTANGTNVR